MPPPSAPSDAARFRDAMALFASGVTVVTTLDAEGAPRGFTASAFASLSVDPPMVLACLGRDADCYDAFLAARRFAVSVLRPRHLGLARLFAARGADKFAGGRFRPGRLGAPVVVDALAVVECELAASYPGGDHTILTGLVRHVEARAGVPLVHHRRAFWELAARPLSAAASPADPPRWNTADS